tara:strand:+ start:2895 stop:3440 length:546 start_codon:yes stop_codon:yes gene_type:complete
MSTIATTNIKHASSSSNNIVLTSDGKANIPGHIIQVVSATKTDTFSYTGSTSFTDITGLSVNITPSSTSSKILVMLYLVASQENVPCIRITRDNLAVGYGDAAGNRTRCTAQISQNSGYISGNGTPIFLDSPSTTSQITYKAQISLEQTSNTAYVNRSVNDGDNIAGHRTISSITVMEVAA